VAVSGATDTAVELFTNAQLAGAAYRVTASGVADKVGNVAPSVAVDFSGYGVVDTNLPVQLSPSGGAIVSLLKPGIALSGEEPEFLPTSEDTAEISLVWLAAAGAWGYVVQLATSDDFSEFEGQAGALERSVGSDTTVLTFPGFDTPALKPQRYFWRVRTLGAPTVFDGLYPSACFDVIGSVVYVYCPTDNTSCDDVAAGAVGNATMPALSIAGGLAFAQAYGRRRVHVSGRGGGTAYHEAVRLVTGISLFGGYAPNGIDRDIDAYRTVIMSNDDNVVTAADLVAVPEESTGAEVVFDGFTVQGVDVDSLASGSGGHPNFATGLFATGCDASLTVSHCRILTGAPCAENTRGPTGVEVRASPSSDPAHNPLFLENEIHNRSACHLVDGSATAFVARDASPRLMRNRIDTGSLTDSYNYANLVPNLRLRGVVLTHSNAVLDANEIVAGPVVLANDASTWTNLSTLVGVDVVGGAPILTNNVVVLKSQQEVGLIGVRISEPTAAALIAFNTLVIDTTVAVGPSLVGIAAGGQVTVADNLIAVDRAAAGFALADLGGTSLPTWSSNLAAHFSSLYGTWLVNNLFTAATAPLANTLSDAGANFVACDANNPPYCLAADNPAVSGSGETPACPAADSQSCNFMTDFRGAARTVPASVGAYEAL